MKNSYQAPYIAPRREKAPDDFAPLGVLLYLIIAIGIVVMVKGGGDIHNLYLQTLHGRTVLDALIGVK